MRCCYCLRYCWYWRGCFQNRGAGSIAAIAARRTAGTTQITTKRRRVIVTVETGITTIRELPCLRLSRLREGRKRTVVRLRARLWTLRLVERLECLGRRLLHNFNSIHRKWDRLLFRLCKEHFSARRRSALLEGKLYFILIIDYCFFRKTLLLIIVIVKSLFNSQYDCFILKALYSVVTNFLGCLY